MKTVEEHCQCCAECAGKLKLNRQMMRVFAEMAPEMDVPLKAQAAWRGAVKQEARRKRQRRAYRYIGGIAAAMVVAIGATLAFKMPAKLDMSAVDSAAVRTVERAEEVSEAAEMDYSTAESEEIVEDADYEVIEDAYQSVEEAAEEEPAAMEYAAEASLFEADGATYALNAAMKTTGGPMQEIVMTVDDVERACDYAQDLAQEYEGGIDVQRYDVDGAPCANLYIQLPAANAAEYMEAMYHFDQSGAAAEPVEVRGDGKVYLILVLKSR